MESVCLMRGCFKIRPKRDRDFIIAMHCLGEKVCEMSISGGKSGFTTAPLIGRAEDYTMKFAAISPIMAPGLEKKF